MSKEIFGKYAKSKIYVMEFVVQQKVAKGIDGMMSNWRAFFIENSRKICID